MPHPSRVALCLLAYACTPFVAAATEDQPNFEKIPPGQTFVLAAPVGTTSDVLGMGFDESLSDTDAEGKVHRVFSTKIKRVPENQYFSQFEQLDNEFKLKAHARFLTTSMNVGFSQEKRYMALRVYHLQEVATIVPGKQLDTAPIVAQKIFYGWALNVIIEGEASTFTSEAATELSTAGGDIDATVKRYQLKKYVHLQGLEAKDKTHIPIVVDASRINEEFQVSEKPSPIFIEYKVMKEMFSPKLSWQRGGFSPGRYRLTKIGFKVTSTKANGKPWDAFGNAPDPLVTVLLDGEQIDTCLVRDQDEGVCPSQKVVTLTEHSALQMVVIDKDVNENDDIGSALLENIMAAGRPYSDIELVTQGQLQRATVTFVPVAGPSPSPPTPPAVAAPAVP
ncbi:MAG: hypothetical protein EOO71_04945 [Myxococcaceae bacterium]|nr:MAG: hypothetical protein EOO71_04945 [Myxococcaceae bacterium]